MAHGIEGCLACPISRCFRLTTEGTTRRDVDDPTTAEREHVLNAIEPVDRLVETAQQFGAAVVVQTYWAPRLIIPLAYDSGGVTTSTVTVPLVAALGLGLAETIPGRSAILDGFGLIAFASLTPMIFVMIFGLIVL